MNITTNGGSLRLMRGDSRVSGADIYEEGKTFSEWRFVKILTNGKRSTRGNPCSGEGTKVEGIHEGGCHLLNGEPCICIFKTKMYIC